MGFPARNVTAQGGDRVGVLCMDEFFRRYIGYEQAPDVETHSGIARWMSIPIPALRTVTNGEIFTDPLREFTRRRDEFMAYPEGVRLRKLAIRQQRGCASANL